MSVFVINGKLVNNCFIQGKNIQSGGVDGELLNIETTRFWDKDGEQPQVIIPVVSDIANAQYNNSFGESWITTKGEGYWSSKGAGYNSTNTRLMRVFYDNNLKVKDFKNHYSEFWVDVQGVATDDYAVVKDTVAQRTFPINVIREDNSNQFSYDKKTSGSIWSYNGSVQSQSWYEVRMFDEAQGINITCYCGAYASPGLHGSQNAWNNLNQLWFHRKAPIKVMNTYRRKPPTKIQLKKNKISLIAK